VPFCPPPPSAPCIPTRFHKHSSQFVEPLGVGPLGWGRRHGVTWRPGGWPCLERFVTPTVTPVLLLGAPQTLSAETLMQTRRCAWPTAVSVPDRPASPSAHSLHVPRCQNEITPKPETKNNVMQTLEVSACVHLFLHVWCNPLNSCVTETVHRMRHDPSVWHRRIEKCVPKIILAS
jgi:hypothetical protein